MNERGNGGVKKMEQGGHIILTQGDVERILREAKNSRMSARRAVVEKQERLSSEAVEQYSEPRMTQDEMDTLQKDTEVETFLNVAEVAFWIIFLFLVLFFSASTVFSFVLSFAFFALIFALSIKIWDGIEALMSHIWRKIRRR